MAWDPQIDLLCQFIKAEVIRRVPIYIEVDRDRRKNSFSLAEISFESV